MTSGVYVRTPEHCAKHAKTNANRGYWEARFTALISEKYGGQCYLPKEVSA